MQIEKLGVKHEAILDFILLHQGKVTQEQVAQHFGMTRVWICCIMNSDAFRAKLAERMDGIHELVDLSVADRIRGVAALSLEKLGVMVELSLDPEFILDATDKLLHRAGYAPARAAINVDARQVHNTNNYMPVDQSVLAECRQVMLTQHPKELAVVDVFDAVVRPALTVSAAESV